MNLERALQRRRFDRELQRWADLGRKPRLWWRDDDTRARTPSLDRLLDVSAGRGLPITLAVIPDGTLEGLAEALSDANVAAAQHGTDHRNRGVGGVSQFAPAAPTAEVVAHLSRGRDRLSALPGVLPCYVPPWNVLDTHVEAALLHAGFTAVSASGGPRMQGPLKRLDVHVDILRWKDGPRFRGEAGVLRRLSDRFTALRNAGDWREPTGLLTHHLVHDAAAWDFLERAAGGCLADPRIAWTDLASEIRLDPTPSTLSRAAVA